MERELPGAAQIRSNRSCSSEHAHGLPRLFIAILGTAMTGAFTRRLTNCAWSARRRSGHFSESQFSGEARASFTCGNRKHRCLMPDKARPERTGVFCFRTGEALQDIRLRR